MVEALTIVLAMGVTRGWRAALTGAVAATFALAAIIAALGPALVVIPIEVLRLVVGALLLVFGLQWLRKAILRASGWRALRDEDSVFARETAAAATAAHEERAGLDWYGFTVSFKAAVVLVIAAGVIVRGPLSRVPENTLAFAVGVMLTTFGTFWGAEGAGVDWPGGDASLPGVLAFVALVSLGFVTTLRRRRVALA